MFKKVDWTFVSVVFCWRRNLQNDHEHCDGLYTIID